MFLVISITSSNASTAAYPWNCRICLNLLLNAERFAHLRRISARSGLGGEFFADIERTLQLIERYPKLGVSVPRVPIERGPRSYHWVGFLTQSSTEKRKSKSESLLSPITIASQDTGPSR